MEAYIIKLHTDRRRGNENTVSTQEVIEYQEKRIVNKSSLGRKDRTLQFLFYRYQANPPKELSSLPSWNLKNKLQKRRDSLSPILTYNAR